MCYVDTAEENDLVRINSREINEVSCMEEWRIT